MIFATVGTNEAPFDRLVSAVDAIESDDVFVQYGSATVRPTRARGVDYLPFETLVEHVDAADLVITHAGAGSALVALAAGKRPILVPRLHRFGEAVDDHQLWFGRRLEERSLAVVVENMADLSAAIENASGHLPARALQVNSLTQELRETIDLFAGERYTRRRQRFFRRTIDYGAAKETD